MRSLRTSTALDAELMEKVKQLSELANTGAEQNERTGRTESNATCSTDLHRNLT